MTIRFCSLIFFIFSHFMAHSQRENKDSVVVTSIVEHPVISPFVEAKFKTIYDWLSSICDGNQPKISISEFKINLSFSKSLKPSKHLLYLYGVNTYTDEKNHSATRIDFEPSNMVFRFPEQGWKNLEREQLKEKVIAQVRNFLKTEKFKTSFLSSAKITAEFNGDVLWSK